MVRKTMWLCLCFLLFVVSGYAQNKKTVLYGVAFYNLENLFDTSMMRVRMTMNTCLMGKTSGRRKSISRS